MKEEIKKAWNLYGIYYIETMEIYCVSCKKCTANKKLGLRKTKQHRLTHPSNFAICCKRKSTFT